MKSLKEEWKEDRDNWIKIIPLVVMEILAVLGIFGGMLVAHFS